MDDIHNEIIGMSRSHFWGRDVNPDAIREFIRMMDRAYSDTEIDEAWLFNKLESIHSVSIGTATTLDDMTGHEEWFNPATNAALKRELSWHFWGHYREYLTLLKGWPPGVVESIDSLSSEILSRIEDPQRPDNWDRRGMVMGSVQSGKTANYTALITKAADAGYKLFIVLAGVHNSLRSQTQSRLNEEFLGYDLDRVQKLTELRHLSIAPRHPAIEQVRDGSHAEQYRGNRTSMLHLAIEQKIQTNTSFSVSERRLSSEAYRNPVSGVLQ